MARRRFFVQEVRRGAAELTGSDAEHLVRVLRAEVGQVYEISDNKKLYLAEIETARKSLVSFRVLEQLALPVPIAAVHLYPALFKFDRFEWMIEKATELGVTGIHPFQAARSERGLGEAGRKRIVRWERIALEASQQSRRMHLPEIHSPAPFKTVLSADATVRLLLDEESSAQPVLTVVESLSCGRNTDDSIALVTGPEGGWTEEEKARLTAADWSAGSLGPTILRAETAAIAAISVVNAAWRR
jgi:16S rRNA (uracil1498-N3)-methyltransferase